jgi:hypothetical protein
VRAYETITEPGIRALLTSDRSDQVTAEAAQAPWSETRA